MMFIMTGFMSIWKSGMRMKMTQRVIITLIQIGLIIIW